MKLWIGRYADPPSEWFLVWAQTLEEALEFATYSNRPPDPQSLHELTGRGHLELLVKREDDSLVFVPTDLLVEEEEPFDWVTMMEQE